ncbi:hypothetical protein GCM10010277_37170 [Streptomyces longisporoflavus]|uniref:hypothetical protein n=1 Tax=Streptomyces longisporoflavus TaxID=28044 RepID=UPI00167ECFDC|nr:hypothetical protein [Streptomyces longisporoflavus]GGV45897.1 hypothetical protein GCM10010277_37170 [Streptomyces longisporoflavus]
MDAPADITGSADTTDTTDSAEGPYAECVLCRKPTEYPQTHKGVTLCPVCEWHEAQRTACSG